MLTPPPSILGYRATHTKSYISTAPVVPTTMSTDGTVNETRGFRTDAEMGVIGYLIGAILLVLVVPLLPFLALVWLYDKVTRG